MKINDQEFDEIISEAMDKLPQQYIKGLNNVLITYEDDPTLEQRTKLHLRCNETLYGLYEGIPVTKRPAANSILGSNVMSLPDKITIFKNPIIRRASSLADIKKQVTHTLWHEIAHYYGLDHDRIHKIEKGEIL